MPRESPHKPRPQEVFRALRLHQWWKNLLVFAPLVAAHKVTDDPLLASAFIAFLAFGLCASSGYVANDLLDLRSDRRHPLERSRPFAAGTLPLSWGVALVPCVLLVAQGSPPRRRPRSRRPLHRAPACGFGCSPRGAVVLALYINSGSVRELYAHPEVIWMPCPLLLYWVSRIWLLARRGELHHRDPLVFACRDPASWVVAALGMTFSFLATWAMDRRYQSWGRYPRAIHEAVRVHWRHADLPLEGFQDRTLLPYGNGRSYGDSCLNDGGVLLDVRGLDRFIRFDAASGVLRCEAGVMLSDVLDLIVPRGWFLPVLPGTELVTLGGAIANDVHGKNHHRAGTFGCHVRSFELLRSDGTRTLCSPERNAELFRATIGGLGLTGTILWAELALRPVSGPFVDSEVIRFGSLDESFPLSEESDRTFDYTVAWIDSLARGKARGRGLFLGGNHSDEEAKGRAVSRKCRFRFRVEPPVPLVNRTTLRVFNAFHYRRHFRRRRRRIVHYGAFFHPLDALGQWNRVYGPKGLLPHQCVLPHGPGRSALGEDPPPEHGDRSGRVPGGPEGLR